MRLNLPLSTKRASPLTRRNPPVFALWCAEFIPAGTGTIARGCFAAGLILQSRLVLAQEALRNSLTSESSVEAQQAQAEALPYTFKSGDFRLLVAPSLDFQWDDNVTLQETQRESDFVLRPAVDFDLNYPLTVQNLVQLSVTCGYDYYFRQHDLSALYLASGSGLSFDVGVGDFKFNLHDNFSYSQDSATEAAVSGTGSYGTFQNTAGLSGTWSLGDVTLTLGYDHQNSLATSSQFSYLDDSSEMLLGRLGFQVYPRVTLGVEGTGSIINYTQMALNDSTGWSGGIYGEWTPGAYLKIKPRFGYSRSYYRQTSTIGTASDLSSWYADLTMSHEATRFLTYSLSVGHELRPGVESDALEDTYVRPSLNWNVINGVSVGTTLSYEKGTQRGGQIANTFGQNYDYYAVGLNLGFTPVTRVNASLYYRLTLRSADVASAGYTQNVVGITLAYALP
jgi:hypothetical protein